LKSGEQFLGVRFGVPAGDREGKKKFQKFVIPEGFRASGGVFFP
jgi:hypothetical protein